MRKKKEVKNIDSIKDKIVNFLMIVYAVISVPLLLLSISRTTVTGWLPVYYLQVLMLVFFIVIFILRKSLHYKQKAFFSSLILLVLCLSGMHCLGLFSGVTVFLILLAVLSALFLGKKYGYAALLVVFLSYTVYAILYGLNILSYDFDLAQMIEKKNVWISDGIILLVVAFSIIHIVTRFESVYIDILKKSAKSESEYRLLFEQAAEGIIIASRDGKILMVNEYFKKVSGYSDTDVIGKDLYDYVIVERSGLVKRGLEKLTTQNTIVSTQKVFNKKGEIRTVDVRVSLLPDGRIQVLFTDISKQQEFQKEIEEQKAFEKSLIETLPGVFYIFENYDRLVQWNDGLLSVSGYSKIDIQNKHPNDLFASVDYHNDIATAFQSSDSAFFRADLICNSGKTVPLYHSAVSFERNGKIYLMGMGYDISNLVAVEEELKNSKEDFRNIYDNTSDAIFIFNHDFELLSANETFFTLTGLKRSHMDKINVFDYIFDYNALQKVAGEIKQVDKGRVVVAEYSIRNAYGKSFPVEVRSRRITYQGQPAVVTAFNDISARRNLEKKVYAVSVKAEEDERGRIAKDLHDGLGPLLSTCKIYLHNLKNAAFVPREAHSFSKLSELINESLTGIKEISNNLSPHVLRNFGLVHALNVFLDKLSAFNNVKINSKLDAPGKYDEIVEITLYRIASELINNTLKHSNAKNINVELKENNGKLYFNYSDDGKGFNPDNVEEKKPGIGLFNIQSRIKSIGGSIVYKTSVGKGVNVEIVTSI